MEQEYGEYHRFHRTFVHKMNLDKLTGKQRDQLLQETSEDAQEIIKQVVANARIVTTREGIKQAFLCFCWFGEELMNTDEGKRYRTIVENYNGIELIEELSDGLDEVAILLKNKGGLTEEEKESEWQVQFFLDDMAMLDQYGHCPFMDVRQTLWGEPTPSPVYSEFGSDEEE